MVAKKIFCSHTYCHTLLVDNMSTEWLGGHEIIFYRTNLPEKPCMHYTNTPFLHCRNKTSWYSLPPLLGMLNRTETFSFPHIKVSSKKLPLSWLYNAYENNFKMVLCFLKISNIKVLI